MRCTLCRHGETHPGNVTVTLNRGDTVIIVKAVPAEICENCGEYYLSQQVTSQILEKAKEAYAKGVEVEILRFAA